MLRGVRAGAQLAVDRCLREHGGVGHQQVHCIDRLVQVVLDRVEVAVVGVGDLRGDVALGDAIDVVRSDVKRVDDRVQGVVNALHNLAEVAQVPGSVRAGGQLTVDRGLREHAGIGHQQVHRVDRLVQVVLDQVEVAAVGVGDFRGDVALRDAIDIVCSDVERGNDGFEGVVDALDNLAESAFELRGVGAGGETSGLGGISERNGLADHRLDGLHHTDQRRIQFIVFAALADSLEGLEVAQVASRNILRRLGHGAETRAQRLEVVVDERLLAGELLEFRIEVALGKLRHASHRLFLHRDMALDHIVDALRHDAEGAFELVFGDHHVDVAQVVLVGHVGHVVGEGTDLAPLPCFHERDDGAGGLVVIPEGGSHLEEHFLLLVGSLVGNDELLLDGLTSSEGGFDGSGLTFVVEAGPGFLAYDLGRCAPGKRLHGLVPERDLSLAVDGEYRHGQRREQQLVEGSLSFIVLEIALHIGVPLRNRARQGRD